MSVWFLWSFCTYSLYWQVDREKQATQVTTLLRARPGRHPQLDADAIPLAVELAETSLVRFSLYISLLRSGIIRLSASIMSSMPMHAQTL
eukprot:COSAG05_NODE_416_length_10031_cov_18.951067_5_plen_90_part_00